MTRASLDPVPAHAAGEAMLAVQLPPNDSVADEKKLADQPVERATPDDIVPAPAVLQESNTADPCDMCVRALLAFA